MIFLGKSISRRLIETTEIEQFTALSLAAEKAFSQWAAREKDLDSLLEDIGDPVEGIEGMLSHLKTDSITLQHKASQIRARRALAHAVHRRKRLW